MSEARELTAGQAAAFDRAARLLNEAGIDFVLLGGTPEDARMATNVCRECGCGMLAGALAGAVAAGRAPGLDPGDGERTWLQ